MKMYIANRGSIRQCRAALPLALWVLMIMQVREFLGTKEGFVICSNKQGRVIWDNPTPSSWNLLSGTVPTLKSVTPLVLA